MVGIDLPERGDGFFGETVSEIFALGIGAEILERQNRAWGAALTLVALVLILNVIARAVSRRSRMA